MISTLVLMSSCTNESSIAQEETTHTKSESMNSMNPPLVSLFEIPASDISRAISFYENILSLDVEHMEMEGMKMGIFPYENQLITGVIVETDGYTPSSDGVVIYFNGGNDLQVILDKIELNGGKVLIPKTPHADESGFFALFNDSEGNRIGLNSPN